MKKSSVLSLVSCKCGYESNEFSIREIESMVGKSCPDCGAEDIVSKLDFINIKNNLIVNDILNRAVDTQLAMMGRIEALERKMDLLFEFHKRQYEDIVATRKSFEDD